MKRHWGIAWLVVALGARLAAAGAPALQAGFGVRDMTPPPGAEMPFGYLKPLVSTGVHDKLLASACVIYDGATPVALVGVDAVCIGKQTVHQARRAIFEATKIPPDNVLIGANHTHTGGPIITGRASKADPRYLEQVVHAITGAVTDAWRSLQAVELGIGTGREDTSSFNRRFLMRDGRESTQPGKPGTPHHDQIVAPAGPIDPDVGVLVARTAQGQVAGVVVNFACHGTVMTGDKFSPDYVGYLRKHLKTYYGEQTRVVFLLGACGDVTQVENMSIGEEFGPEYADLFGMKLAAETTRTIGRVSWLKEASVAVVVENVMLPIRPEMDTESEAPLLHYESVPPEYWAGQRRLVAEERQRSPKIACEVQAIRIGPLAIVTNGAELFCEYGLRIKKASLLRSTWVVTLANEYIGYVCTPQAFMAGGYEPRTQITSKMGIEAGQ